MADKTDEIRPFGYSDVDGSGREGRLQELLKLQAEIFEASRRERFATLDIQTGCAILDVGCGLGEVAAMFAEAVGPTGRVVGIDLSEAMVAAASAAVTASNVEFKLGNAAALDFEDDTFDVVHSERVFMHLDDPAAAVRECARVLKPGGRLMIVDPDHMIRGSDADDPEAAEILWRALSSSLIKNPRSGRRLRGQFIAAGLVDVTADARLEILFEPMYGREKQAEYLELGLRAAVDRGELDEARGKALIEDQLRRLDSGTYLDAAAMFTVSGRKTAGS